MKKKKILSLLMALAMIVTLLPAVSLPAQADYTATDTMSELYAAVVTNGGTAPTEGVYSICSDTELIYLAEYTNAGGNTSGVTFYLTDDIVLNNNASEYESWGTSAPANTWTPIGNYSNPFSGTFDGGKHTVSGIYINNSSGYQGLFGCVDGGTVQNVGVIDSYIAGSYSVGGVVGYNFGTVEHCYNTGSVEGSNESVGGMVGYNFGTVEHCYNTGSVCGNSNIGGVAGYNWGAVEYTYNTGSVCGNSNIGGVAGYNYNSTVTSCYYDKQMCPCEAGIGYDDTLSSSSSTGAEGLLTSEMTSGTALTGLDASVWTYTSGLYPRLAGMDTTDAAYISASPVFLQNEETVKSVTTDFSVSLANGVEWSSSDNCLSIDSETGSVTIVSNGTDVILTATLNGVSKSVELSDINYVMSVVDASQEYDADTNPIAISSAADLAYLAQQVNSGETITYTDSSGSGSVTASTASYRQTDDIVLNDNASEYESWGTSAPSNTWTPIGNYSNRFSGTFDGGEHTVSGIYINNSSDYQGLFGYVSGGTIKNAGVIDSYIAGSYDVGGVVGYNCGAVENCYNTGSVEGGNSNIGGVVGTNCGAVEYCYNTGSVSGLYSVGGVVGIYSSSSTVTNCYNTGSVEGSEDVGGVVGENCGAVEYCYNTGSVCGSVDVGGVAGSSGGTVSNCYYDKQMCPCEAGIGYDDTLSSSSSTGAVGKLTSDMVGQELSSLLGTDSTWTFTNESDIEDNLYPRLAGMDTTDAAYISASPVFLQNEETVESVQNDFAVSTANDVTWTSTDSTVVKISGTSAALKGSGSVTLTATLNGISKTVVITSTKPYSIRLSESDTYSLTALTAGYTSGSQETKTITITNNGTQGLTSLAVTLSETNADNFTITQPTNTLDSSSTTTFTISAIDGLAAGTYTATVTVSADNMTDETFTVTQVVNSAPSSGGGSSSTDNNDGEEIIISDSDGNTATGTLTETDNGATADIPRDNFDKLAETDDGNVTFDMGIATVEFSGAAVDTISGSSDEGEISLTVEEADTSTRSGEAQELVGGRPVYDLTLMAGDTQITELGGKATISVTYEITDSEDPNAIVVYYIDDDGNLTPVRGSYDAETGKVEFTVIHFSKYAMGYNEVSFADVSNTDWYYDAVTFIAAREITSGVGDGSLFAANDYLTRGQFIVMLMRAYDIEVDEEAADNFADAGDTYYTSYLATAKRLGITCGVGDNMFAPEKEITRQDMFTLLYRALNVLGELPETDNTTSLSDFSDADEISNYAEEAMETFAAAGIISGSYGKLDPQGGSTRAQMAQVLYNLLSK